MRHVDGDLLYTLLRDALGTGLIADGQLPEKILMVLNSCRLSCESFTSASQQIDNLLFSALYSVRMCPMMDDGVYRRITTEQLTELSDDCMLPLFLSMPTGPANLGILNEYAIRNSSRSAQAALYLRFAGYMSEREREMLRRILLSRYPVLPDWLRCPPNT